MNSSSIMSLNFLEEYANTIKDNMHSRNQSVSVLPAHLCVDGVYEWLPAIRRSAEQWYHPSGRREDYKKEHHIFAKMRHELR